MSKYTVIKNATLVMCDHLIPDAAILAEDGKICNFGKNIEIPEGAEIIDAHGNYVGPGLIDIHAHAAGPYGYYTDPADAADYALSHGVTSIMPSLAYSQTKEGYLNIISLIETALSQGRMKNFIGYHMEGPYLNPNFGANRNNLPWPLKAEREDYIELIKAVKEKARVWCFAPERPGIEEFVKDVLKEIPDIVFSVAHSEATPQMIEKYIPLGLKIATHHTNATGTIINYPECRGVCVDEAVNYNDDIFAELICDSCGIHVDPYMLRLVKKIKGDDKIILISDATVSKGPKPEGYDGVNDINFDNYGEISGSKLTLDKACRNMMVHTGCSICEAFRYASRNPARALSLRGMGEIRVGGVANLIIVDDKFDVKNVIFKGDLVK